MKGLCAAPSCNKKATSLEWCGNHYQRWKTYGDAEEPLRLKRGEHRFNENGDKWCSRCKEYIPLNDHTTKTWCRLCRRLFRYNMYKEKYFELLKKQDNKCAICLDPNPTQIDHDHNCCVGGGKA